MNPTRFFRTTLAAAALGVSAFVAGCASTEPVNNLRDVPISADLSTDQFQEALVRAGQERGWIIKHLEPGHSEGTLLVRSHVAKVDIFYDADSYSIVYKDSENLDYADGEIHNNYNGWIQFLNNDIQRAVGYM